jgi:hypothetical protein
LCWHCVTPGPELNLLARFVQASARSWWEARWRDGRTLAEWGTLPGISARVLLPGPMRESGWRSRWEEVDKVGMVGLRLLCPNGHVGELEAARDHALFQFKVGAAYAGPLHLTGSTEVPPHQAAHVIGAIENDRGDCRCFAWEPEGRLVQFSDNVFRFRYKQVGPLGLENLGLKV